MILNTVNTYENAVCYDGVGGGKYYLIDTVPKLKAMCAELAKQPLIAFDSESSGVNTTFDHPCGFSLGFGASNNFYIPFEHISHEKQLDKNVVAEHLKPIFDDANISWVGHNSIFDRHMYMKLGLSPAGMVHDTLLLSFLWDENGDHGLKGLSDLYVHPEASKWETSINSWRVDEAKRRRQSFNKLIKDYIDQLSKQVPNTFQDKKDYNKHLKEIALEKYSNHPDNSNKKTDISYDYIPVSLMAPYAASDVHYTWMLYKKYLPLIANDKDLTELYLKECQLSRILFDTEYAGAFIDRKYLEELGPSLDNEIKQLSTEIFEEVGYKFNIDSNDDLIEVFEKQGVQLTKLTKGSKEKFDAGVEDGLQYSVDKKVIQGLATKYKFADKILSYNKAVTIKSRYVDGLIAALDNQNVVHCSYNQNVSSGRMSARGVNLMNIPNGDKRIKRAFAVPNDDYIFVFIDESQIELRILAHVSQDPKLLAAYPLDGSKGIDIHTNTLAECILGCTYQEALQLKEDDIDQFTELRRISKILIFSIVYGAGARGIQDQICTPERYYDLDTCKKYLDTFYAKYTGVKRWIDQTKNFILNHGYTQNIFGRYRRFPGIKQVYPKWKQAGLLRSGVNSVIQGSAADLFKESIIRIAEILKNTKSRMVNFVHDEIQFYIHREELHLVPLIKQAMEDFDLRVPLVAEVSVSTTNWADKKELK